MSDLPAEIEVWFSRYPIDYMGTWATTRYPAEAVTYVPKADAEAAVALALEEAAEVVKALGIRSVIDGLASDLQELRAGTISPVDAMARAHLAKQFFNGARLVLLAMKELRPQEPPASAAQIAEAKDA